MASEQQLQSKIIRFLKNEGWLVVKTIVLSVAGYPDIFAFRKSVAIFIEVKAPNGRASKLQQHRIEQLNKHGFFAEIVYSYNEFLNKYIKHLST